MADVPAAADQEDFVSMGMNGALKTKQILKNANNVVAIELIAAAQALDFREFTPGVGTRTAKDSVHKVVAHLDLDGPLFTDHNNMTASVTRCEVLEAVENAFGPLHSSWA